MRNLSQIFYLPIFAATLAAALTVATSAEAVPFRLIYRVTHSTYGAIGTYTNIIDKIGNATTVTTEGRIRVGILGVTLYRQDADRVERWNGDRLVSFRGVTKTNDRPPLELSGAAQGDRFVVMSPFGEFEAPASVRPANPWSPAVLKGETLFTTDRGIVENVQVQGGETVSVPLANRSVQAKHYHIDRGNGRSYEVWIDNAATVVKFSLVNSNATIAFTLDK
jgi:hypothetical protein